MKILVTGGAGFIGSNFIYYVLNKHEKDHVVCLDALTYAGSLATLTNAMKDERFKFVKGDITDEVYGIYLWVDQSCFSLKIHQFKPLYLIQRLRDGYPDDIYQYRLCI